MQILEKIISEDTFDTLVNKTNAGLDSIKSVSDRLDGLIIDGVPTDGNSELIDIRTGYDGVLSSTAGESVRYQVQKIYDSVVTMLVSLNYDLVYDLVLKKLFITDSKGVRIGKGTKITTDLSGIRMITEHNESGYYLVTLDPSGSEVCRVLLPNASTPTSV